MTDRRTTPPDLLGGDPTAHYAPLRTIGVHDRLLHASLIRRGVNRRGLADVAVVGNFRLASRRAPVRRLCQAPTETSAEGGGQTLQQNVAGVWVRAAVPNVSGSSFTVYLSKAVSASTKVGWFVVN